MKRSDHSSKPYPLLLALLIIFRCFAIDRSGFVVIHKDFLTPPSSQVHITSKEPQVAADLITRGILRNDSCVSYADITNQLFWEVRRRRRSLLCFTNCQWPQSVSNIVRVQSSSLPCSLPSFSLPLEVHPLIQLRGLGERCKLPSGV